MNDKNLKTAVLFMVFNRLEPVSKSLEAIRRVQPERLYIGADGARPDRKGEQEKVDAVRKYLMDGIDWQCEIKTLFQEKNLGCREAPLSAINWFFKNEEEGIIIEDDCVPGLSFFRYCNELLERYRNEPRIMCVSGNVFHNSRKIRKYSYYFSHIPHIWGWATWRRAWQLYDADIKAYPEFKEKNKIEQFFKKPEEQRYWLDILLKVYEGEYKYCWDYQWLFALLNNNGLACTPKYNLVANVGFGADATHTINWSYQPPVKHLAFPMVHPDKIEAFSDIDSFAMKAHFLPRSLPYRALRKGFRIIRKYSERLIHNLF